MKFKMDFYTSTVSQCPAVYDENNKLVAQVVYGNTEDKAIRAAVLLAAAPELLEALENMEKVFYNAGRCYSKEEIDAIKLAYSAIHKAKGESK